MNRRAPLLLAAALLIAGCGNRHIETDAHIDWTAPVFVDSGKVGMFEVAWDEVYTTCGVLGNDVCSEPRRARAFFIVFSPADGALDTLFEAAPRAFDFDLAARAAYQAPWLYYEYAGTHAAYNMETGVHRAFPDLGVFLGTFSRSGLYVVYDQRRVELATGAVTNVLPAPWHIDYYDDLAGEALVYRWARPVDNTMTRYMVHHDFRTGAFDSARAWPGVMHPKPVDGGRVVLWSERKSGGIRTLTFERAATLDLAAPALDSVATSSMLAFTDLDLAGRRLVGPGTPPRNGFGAAERGIVLAAFDGGETTYHARAFHPEYPAAVPTPP